MPVKELATNLKLDLLLRQNYLLNKKNKELSIFLARNAYFNPSKFSSNNLRRFQNYNSQTQNLTASIMSADEKQSKSGLLDEIEKRKRELAEKRKREDEEFSTMINNMVKEKQQRQEIRDREKSESIVELVNFSSPDSCGFMCPFAHKHR